MSGRRRLAQILRELASELVTAAADDSECAEIADALEPLRARLAARPRRTRRVGASPAGHAEEPRFDYGRMDEFSPVTGLSNPLAPPLSLWLDGRVARGQVSYGGAYEGPPGGVHGGYLAAGFDEVFGMTHALTGEPGVTGTLTVRFRRLAPLHAALRFEGRLQGAEGRKVFLASSLRADETLLAEAEAVFVGIDPERYGAMADARNRGRC